MASPQREPISDIIYMLVKDETSNLSPYVTVTAFDSSHVDVRVGRDGQYTNIRLSRDEFKEMAQAFNTDSARRWRANKLRRK